MFKARLLILLVVLGLFPLSGRGAEIFQLSDTEMVYIESSMPSLIAELRQDASWARNFDRWAAVEGPPGPSDWAARNSVWKGTKARQRDIRKRIESKYKTTDYFEFGDGTRPEQVNHIYVGIDAHAIGIPEYVNVCYLKVGEETKSNTINGASWTPGLSHAIKVNQEGYLPDARKYAYVGAHLYPGSLTVDSKSFTVTGGDTTYAGKVVDKGLDETTGERVYELDFSKLTEPGVYRVSVPGIGHSYPFRIDDNVYDKPFAVAMEGFRHQRCGTEITGRFARKKCHQGPVYESEHININTRDMGPPPWKLKRFDVIGHTTDKTQPRTARGGWHDAADWDRNAGHYTVVFDMLYAYEMNPHPKLLEEVAHGLLVWMDSMNEDGGVSGYLETDGHHNIDSGDYAFSRRTRWDSLSFSAACAMMARLTQGLDAKQWHSYATRAWRFGSDPANSLGKVTVHAAKKRGKGEPYTVEWTEEEKFVTPYLTHAAIEMYRLTGEEHNKTHIDTKIPSPYRHPYTYADHSPWRAYGAVSTPGVIGDEERRQLIKRWYLDPADKLIALTESGGYRRALQRDKKKGLRWGVSVMTNPARCLLIAWKLSGDIKYRDAALVNIDFDLGANPLGMCWTPGLGENHPVIFQHTTMPPGIRPYGISEGSYYDDFHYVQIDDQRPEVPLWRQWSPHPRRNVAHCEFTIQETMSSVAFCSAVLRQGEYVGEITKNETKLFLP
jgi:hypothetical protein